MEKEITIKKSVSYNEWVEWNEMEHEDKEIALITLWTGESHEEISGWNIDIYTHIMNIIGKRLEHEPSMTFRVDDKEYKIQGDKTKWSFRAWIDIEEIIKMMGTTKAAPYILYILSNDKYDTSDNTMAIGKEWGDKIPFQDVLNVLNFFLLREKQLKENTKLFSQAEDQINQLVSDIKISVENGAGIQPLKAYQQMIFLNRTMSLIDPSYKSLTISRSSVIKAMLRRLKESIWNKLKGVKDKLQSFI